MTEEIPILPTTGVPDETPNDTSIAEISGTPSVPEASGELVSPESAVVSGQAPINLGDDLSAVGEAVEKLAEDVVEEVKEAFAGSEAANV